MTACEHVELSSQVCMTRDDAILSSVQRKNIILVGEVTTPVMFLAWNLGYLGVKILIR